jgi:serine/threonine protein kinase
MIIYKNELFALKRIPKSTIDKVKRIEHLKNEKNILSYLNKDKSKDPINFIVHLEETFTDSESIDFIFEYLPG